MKFDLFEGVKSEVKSKKSLKKKKTLKKKKVKVVEEEEEEYDQEEPEEPKKAERDPNDEDPASYCQFCCWNFREGHRCLSLFAYYNNELSRSVRVAIMVMSWYLLMVFSGFFVGADPVIIITNK